MSQSPQEIRVSRDGIESEATVTWRWSTDNRWTVSIKSLDFEATEACADDAFEALCMVRERLESAGWRIGVVGAQIDVWPSGMARDQGGGRRAYRLVADGAGDLVDTFEPTDPATVTTVAEQRAAYERWYEAVTGRPSGHRS